ncbi:MAG: chloride channel protein [Actinobacteria bacterium]|nr:chloride channel protein [Actinomycetota bacterium]
MLQRFWSSRTASTAALAAIVGAGTGLGAVAFIKAIEYCQRFFFDGGAHAFPFLGGYYVIILPVFGGLIVGPLVHFLAPEAKGHGVPEVMTAIETKGGRMKPMLILVKTVGSAITIGSGGSAGREGPIVQIGAAIGSVFGQRLKLDRARLLTLVAAGAAGGIAGTFNAPIAGVMFTFEVLAGEFTVTSVGSMVFAAVSSAAVVRLFLGNFPAFQVPAWASVSNWELLMYLGLGILAAFAALLFVRSLYAAEDLFDKWSFPTWLKAPVAGITIGLIGYFFPQVFGTGFPAMTEVLRGGFSLGLLIALVFMRIAATSLTLASGFSGGVFAPALFIGSMLGGAYGRVMHALFPTASAGSGAYALVGMAAVFAGAARAPVTAIVIVFEMTLDYKVMLPLMFATVVSTLIAARFEPESIYTLKLVRRGIDFMGQRGTRHVSPVTASEAMTPLDEAGHVSPQTSLADLEDFFERADRRAAVVLGAKGELLGLVTVADLERALVGGDLAAKVEDIYSRNPRTAQENESLDELVKRAGMLDLEYVPVVGDQPPHTPIGVLSRLDIIRSYAQAISARDRRFISFERRRAQSVFGLQPVEVDLEEGDLAVGRTLREVNPPPEAVVISIVRRGTVLVPRGDRVLEKGDHVVGLALAGTTDLLLESLKGRRV